MSFIEQAIPPRSPRLSWCRNSSVIGLGRPGLRGYRDNATMVKKISTALVASAVPSPIARNLRDSERMDCSSRGCCRNGQAGRPFPAALRLPGWGTVFRVELHGQPVVTRGAGHVGHDGTRNQLRMVIQQLVGQWYKYPVCHEDSAVTDWRLTRSITLAPYVK